MRAARCGMAVTGVGEGRARTAKSAVRRVAFVAGVAVALVAAGFAGQWTGRELNRPAMDVPAAIDFGRVTPGETLTRDIVVKNRGRVPLRLVGGTSDCSCLVSELPPPIAPGQSAAVRVTLKVPADARGRVERAVELFGDSPRRPRAVVQVGYVVE